VLFDLAARGAIAIKAIDGEQLPNET
jgi:hypothetical protein